MPIGSPRLARALLVCILLLLASLANPVDADGPDSWEAWGGHDGYYIARGWTAGYSSKPLAVEPPARPAVALPHTIYLPAAAAGEAPRETRAVWVTRWDYRRLADIQAIVDKAAYANLNTILFQVRGQADAFYRSELEPWSSLLTGTLGRDPGWDPLAEMVARAHAAGIEVHAWINVYPAWLGTQDPATLPPTTTVPLPMYHDFNARYGSDWIQWTRTGPMQFPPGPSSGYLCASPAHSAVVERIVRVSQDILAHYPVDGLHFDYIRYAGAEYSYDPVSQWAYAAAAAAEPGLTRAEWQRRQVTYLLQRVRQEALPLRPTARLTTSAWPIYQDRWGWVNGWDGYNAYYQDAQGWARTGLVSGIMPMLYGSAVRDYRERYEILAHDFVDGSAPGGAILGVIGDYDSFLDIAGRIAVARAAGARGQALFSYRLFDERNYWQALRQGPYARAARPNW